MKQERKIRVLSRRVTGRWTFRVRRLPTPYPRGLDKKETDQTTSLVLSDRFLYVLFFDVVLDLAVFLLLLDFASQFFPFVPG